MARNKTALLGASPIDGMSVRAAGREAMGVVAKGARRAPFPVRIQNYTVPIHRRPEALCRVFALAKIGPEGKRAMMPEKSVVAVAGRMAACQKITPVLGK